MKIILIVAVLFSWVTAEAYRQMLVYESTNERDLQELGDYPVDKKENSQLLTIHEAARQGDVAMIETHMETGTDVNAKGEAPLPPNWENMINHPEVRERLVRSGADINAEVMRQTPLHYAVAFGPGSSEPGR